MVDLVKCVADKEVRYGGRLYKTGETFQATRKFAKLLEGLRKITILESAAPQRRLNAKLAPVQAPPQSEAPKPTETKLSDVKLPPDDGSKPVEGTSNPDPLAGETFEDAETSDDTKPEADAETKPEGDGAGAAVTEDLRACRKARLVEIAKAEGVKFETDDNKPDLIGKIEAHRAASAG